MEWDEICYQLLGERPGRLWQLAGRNGIDAVRCHQQFDQRETGIALLAAKPNELEHQLNYPIFLFRDEVDYLSPIRSVACGCHFQLRTDKSIPARLVFVGHEGTLLITDAEPVRS